LLILIYRNNVPTHNDTTNVGLEVMGFVCFSPIIFQFAHVLQTQSLTIYLKYMLQEWGTLFFCDYQSPGLGVVQETIPFAVLPMIYLL